MAEGLLSRKFLVTISVVLCTTALAYLGKMDQNVSFVFAASIAAYNWANLRQSQNGSAPKV